MARTLPTLLPADLELRLLRKGVDVLVEGRDRCSDCGRTPLTGEHVHHYAAGAVVCELCRQLRRDEPHRTAKVLHSEHGQTVKVRAA
jgi:hypothetical protein